MAAVSLAAKAWYSSMGGQEGAPVGGRRYVLLMLMEPVLCLLSVAWKLPTNLINRSAGACVVISSMMEATVKKARSSSEKSPLLPR